jgi:hypothetical protein
MAEEKHPTWPPIQPYDFGQGRQPSTPEERHTGQENVRYDAETNKGVPDNPKNSREVVERGVVNVANPHPPTSTDTGHRPPAPSPEQKQRVDATAGTDRQIKTIKDWMEAEGNRPETEEERKKRERKEKSKRIIAAVSDGISALGNLFFTSQYAPNMYSHEKGSMTNAVGAGLDRMKAEREKNADKYLQFSLKLGDLENQRAATLRELEAQQERQKLAREKAQREAEAHGWKAVLQDDVRREQKEKANKAAQEAISAQAEAEVAPELQRAKLATERARKGSLDASAANSRASAAAHGRSNVSEFQGLGRDGKLRPFRTRQAAIDYERRQGTYEAARWGDDLEEVVHTEETDRRHKTTRKTKVKPVKGKGYGEDDNKGY